MKPVLPVLALAPLLWAAPDISHADPGATLSQDAVAEIVTFRLVEGSNDTTFREAADAMTPFLKSTGAVVTRRLSKGSDGVWTDHITWTSHHAALTSAEAMMAHPDAAPFLSMIDPGSVQMRHEPILLSME
jgi:hypothetical protein